MKLSDNYRYINKSLAIDITTGEYVDLEYGDSVYVYIDPQENEVIPHECDTLKSTTVGDTTVITIDDEEVMRIVCKGKRIVELVDNFLLKVTGNLTLNNTRLRKLELNNLVYLKTYPYDAGFDVVYTQDPHDKKKFYYHIKTKPLYKIIYTIKRLLGMV